jgi:predicted RNA-binding Zn-ribbon protein involved in translation (DUF1610 family)
MVCRCQQCHKSVEPMPPPRKWKVATALYWFGLLLVSPLYGGILGLSIVLLPAFCTMTWAIGAASRLATTWTCPSCGAEMHRFEAAPRARRVRVHRRAHELQPT